MSDIKLYFHKVLKYEGGFVNDPTDRGGATNRGVTLSTWKAMGYDKDGDGDIDVEDIKLLNDADSMKVCKVGYWDRWQADKIINQSIAETLVEWVWGSGVYGIKIPQRILGLKEDGSVGPKTLAAVNGANQKELHEKIRLAKLDFIKTLVEKSVAKYIQKNPHYTEKDLLKYTQKRFFKGWTMRINEFVYKD